MKHFVENIFDDSINLKTLRQNILKVFKPKVLLFFFMELNLKKNHVRKRAIGERKKCREESVQKSFNSLTNDTFFLIIKITGDEY